MGNQEGRPVVMRTIGDLALLTVGGFLIAFGGLALLFFLWTGAWSGIEDFQLGVELVGSLSVFSLGCFFAWLGFKTK